MGKKGGSGYNLKAALKVVNQLGNQMSGESTADYNVALSALTAGQKNLSKQTRAFTRDMLLSQGQNQQALGALGARARAQSGVVSAKQAATTSRYGAALGASVAAQYNPAAAVAAGTGQVVTGQAKQGKGIGRVGETVAGIAKAGVAAQESAATYSMNQALQQRNIIDNQTLASLTGDLYKTAMSYNMQWALWKKQQDYATKQAEKANHTSMKSLATTLPEVAPDMAVDAWKAMDKLAQEGGAGWDSSEVNVQQETKTWAEMNGVTDENQIALFAATLVQLKRQGSDPSSYNSGQAMQDAISHMYSSQKGWDQYGSAILSSVASGTHVAFTQSLGPINSGYASYVSAQRTAGATEVLTLDQWTQLMHPWASQDESRGTLGLAPVSSVSIGIPFTQF